MTDAVFKLSPGIQSYAWGKKGSASLAAQLGDVCVPDFKVDEGETYAELWMGTHPNVPTKLQSTQETLSAHLKANPELMGAKIHKAFPDSKDGSLPFLFKVLSIGTALSIQAHPDKTLAERLHRERGDVYKDPNHKPEMAIALTPFLAFLNFLPLPTLLLHLLTVPELDDIIPSALRSKLASSLTLPDTQPADPLFFTATTAAPTEEQKAILKDIFEALMTAEESKVKTAIASLVDRYTNGEVAESEKGLVDLVKMLDEQYPGDVGVLCVFILNVVELKKGEAAFLGASMPHAYISGDIIECMATSDNVVRAGLTPKLRDVDTLVNMLTYEASPGSKQLLKPSQFGDSASSLLYDPPIAEFSVVKVSLGADGSEAHRAVEGPSVVVVTEGKGSVGSEEVVRGDVLFVGAGEEVVWKSDEGLELFRAFVEAA